MVSLTSGDDKTSFNSVRIRYQLQVSPAQAIATFNDFPASHIFFQYVEALAAFGITGGCAYNMYCPDDHVTHGQISCYYFGLKLS